MAIEVSRLPYTQQRVFPRFDRLATIIKSTLLPNIHRPDLKNTNAIIDVGTVSQLTAVGIAPAMLYFNFLPESASAVAISAYAIAKLITGIGFLAQKASH